jgi:DNA-binding MarR family transcriptional regulator
MSTPPSDVDAAPSNGEGESRAERIAARVRRIEQEEPLQRRILEFLARESLTPTILADRLEARKESVSRLLKILRDEGLVEIHRVPGDRRRRRYAVTNAGEVELRRHRAYGEPGPRPVEPDHEQVVRFLYSALANSVRMRRHTNELAEAIDRQRKVLREARKLKEGQLVLETMHELATTLRQQGKEPDVTVLLKELEEVQLGRGEYADPALSLQAAAHRSYALGRLGERRKGGQRERANQLITAAVNYCELAKGSTAKDSRKWRERQAWSAFGLAANQRSASQPQDALLTASAALHLFERIEDDYGRSHCLFLLGFCLRLLGDLDGAAGLLGDAQGLAAKHSYARLLANSLMQIGEVHRCRGEHAAPRLTLEESQQRAEMMQLPVIQAFAHTALGSVAFGQGNWLESQLELKRAQRKFEEVSRADERDWEGEVLNVRRLAVAARFEFEERRQGNLTIARQLNDEASRRYQQMRRPAGMVACSVERDRQRMCEGVEPDGILFLKDLIDNKDRERECLESDPWVPSILLEFAKETEDQDLVSRAQQVFAAAQRKLEATLRQAKEIVGPEHPAAASPPPAKANEMGAETLELREESVPSFEGSSEEFALSPA